MKRIAILGSTGSIGKNTLEVIKNFPRRFKVVALSANANSGALYEQALKFKPRLLWVRDARASMALHRRITACSAKLLTGDEGLNELLCDERIDLVVLAISGSAALLPLLQAIKNGKNVALANKEALVMAGPIIMEEARKRKVSILPIDSEQSAIWQCLEGEDKERLKNIYLTASGGPFRQADKTKLKKISVRQVLRHPTWKMGKKVTVDSATLMNKGLEVLETMFLFGVDVQKIKVIIHPQSLIHSMVEFIDGVVLAQLSVADMRIPIQYALSYPERLETHLGGIDFYSLKNLNFQRPDFKRFPCLRLAYRAASQKGTAPCALNAANEVCVEEFLKQRLDFLSIPRVIEKVLDRHKNILRPDLGDIQEMDRWARKEAYRIIGN